MINFLKNITGYTACFEFALKDMTLWSMILLKKLEKKLFIRLYLTIDELPAFNYAKIIETNETYYLKKRGKLKGNFNKEFQQISDQLIDTFGFSQQFIYYINKEKSFNKLWAKYSLDPINNRNLITKLNIKQRELQNISLPKQDNIFDLQSKLWDKYGYIDLKKISIKEFYSLVKTHTENLKNMHNGD